MSLKKFSFGKKSIIDFAKKKGSGFIVKNMVSAFENYFEENVNLLEMGGNSVMFLFVENGKITVQFVDVEKREVLKEMDNFTDFIKDVGECSEIFNIILNGLKAKSENFNDDVLKFESLIVSMIEGADSGEKNSIVIFSGIDGTLVHYCNYSLEPFVFAIYEKFDPKTAMSLMDNGTL